MSRPRNFPSGVVAPTHSCPEGAYAFTMTESAIHTITLPEGSFAALVLSRPENENMGQLPLAVIALLDRTEVAEHIRLLTNAIEDAERVDAGLPMIHAAGAQP